VGGAAATDEPGRSCLRPGRGEVSSSTVDVDVEQVPMGLVLPLRQRVLRPHQQIAEIINDGDLTGVHFAAFDDAGVIVGVASLHDATGDAKDQPRWRLRGMAIEPAWQRKGVGRAVMAALLDFVARSGGGGIRCAARLHAVEFYEKFGFVTVGEVYEEPVIGPHVRMERVVDAMQGQAAT
jgi:predicted GNAT family N-acyltransferase